MFVAADQLIPLKEKTLPTLSVAIQKLEEGHETEVSPLVASMFVAADQLVPL
jgi:hypothetical protein